MEQQRKKESPLATEKISKLLKQFAIPSIIAMLVSAIYNIVDQFFIGHSVGALGNAATNIAFPLSMMCTALALMFGIGGASCFNLIMGEGQKEKAAYFIGNSVVMLLGSGTLLCILTEVFLAPMLQAFGSPAEVLPYAKEYVMITAIGFPFLIITIGGGNLIRADGSPRMTMICNLSGAVINTILDAIFVMGFGWGMKGAAIATIIGQIFSGILVIRYLMHFKTMKLTRKHFMLQKSCLGRIISLGAASCFNQLAMMVVQIALNNLLKYYGALSAYGEAIPIACAGIVTKVNQLFFSIIIGISQGTQPIEGYNYGARNYRRVRDTYALAMKTGMACALGAFLIFQIFPRQLLGLFGDGSESYYQFGISYFRVFLAGTIINFMQPLTSSFFTSIGKAYKGMFLSLTRQIIFLLPLLFAFSAWLGIDGILYAGPVADFMAFAVAAVMVKKEFKTMKNLEMNINCSE
ncbi:MAG: MATE family efflux transporter [Lachnospiraceae bacterium]|nr:MATE family efflux transporter [Lachnospiraceae bacterium]